MKKVTLEKGNRKVVVTDPVDLVQARAAVQASSSNIS